MSRAFDSQGLLNLKVTRKELDMRARCPFCRSTFYQITKDNKTSFVCRCLSCKRNFTINVVDEIQRQERLEKRRDQEEEDGS